MSKKQTVLFKLLVFFQVAFLSVSYHANSQTVSDQLSLADSLFKERKYTESFEIYQKIINAENQATPQMLMKMAYIKEGLGDYSEALLYLNKYYLKTSDQKARDKMTELADEHSLMGFRSTDADFFQGLLNEYFVSISIGLLALSLAFLGIAAYRRFKVARGHMGYAFSAVAILVLFLFFVNYPMGDDQAIIVENHAYLMSGPSAGADLIDVVKKGHRIKVLEETDLWVKIEWNGMPAYVRKHYIRPIS